MLKRDHEILSTCIVEEADGSIKILKSPMTLLYRGGPKSSSSSCSLDSTDEKKGPSQLPTNKIRGGATNNAFQIFPQTNAANTSSNTASLEDPKYFSPMKQSSAQPQQGKEPSCSATSKHDGELRKLRFGEKQHSQSFKSNQSSSVHENDSDLRSKDEIMTQDGEEIESKG